MSEKQAFAQSEGWSLEKKGINQDQYQYNDSNDADAKSRNRRETSAWTSFLVIFVMPVTMTLLLLATVLQLPWLIMCLRWAEFTNADLKDILLTTPSNDSAAEWLRYYTAGPHLAGKNLSQAVWTQDRWQEWGAESSIVAYDLFINYPESHELRLLSPAEETKKSEDQTQTKEAHLHIPGSDLTWKVAFEAPLEEDVLPEDPTTGLADRVPTFHGYSASGNVTGPLVYVNYGTYQDYADLEAANISVAGAVVLVRYGGIFRGLKVKRAQELGAVGALLYSDPGDDGTVTEANGYTPYPKGPARQSSSVQRGSVQFLSVAPGDPTTPGYPSKPGVPRGPTDKYIPQIPSLPISYEDALPLLKALNGHGPQARKLGPAWTKNLGLGDRGVEYSVGPTPSSGKGAAVVHLHNEQEYTTTPIWDTIGIINGTLLANEVIVVGNHRDAWIAGGAVDPNSGSAVLNEVVRSFGEALKVGWQPLRTIVFASWDGEEYGLLGSTEWVEEYLPWLQATTVAYINIDVGVSGPHFDAGASPLLNDLLYNVTAAVQSPEDPSKSVGDVWSGHIGPLGSGSDFTAFLDYAGIASLNVGFSAGDGDPVYHYHSNYDSYYWMANYGDPGFVYHQTMAQILGLLTAKLATDLVHPFSAGTYVDALQSYAEQVRQKLAGHGTPPPDKDHQAWAQLTEEQQSTLRARCTKSTSEVEDQTITKVDFEKALLLVDEAIAALDEPSRKLDEKADYLRRVVDYGEEPDSESKSWLFSIPWWRHIWGTLRRIYYGLKISRVNRKYRLLEQKFLFADGLDNREWFKHVVFAPGLWTGYSGAVFPGLVESIDAGNWANGVRWAHIIAERIQEAAKSL